ncbi:LETM1 and EF-hand domain-containing protein anon-60Da, mitochondrial [Camponotus floridanus]|uniref:Mitochondrial proton/calcium exchanger protein n=1 Tax=Camponotus floridanus TaxID=104421 RepID=E2A0J7_CAMFO|nr:LETM1 and EF-hand domain-containing protein anon-60Da, mitochondrial [Camponotus floridanus]
MINGHSGIIRRYSPFKLWHNTNHTMSGIALIYTGLRDPKRLLLEHNSTVSPKYINNVTYTHLYVRTFYITPHWMGQESSSKVEETVKNIKEEKELKDKMAENAAKISCEQPKKAVAKVTIWQKVKGEILHYYHGFRLLGLDMKISAKLIWRILHGKELSRREHRLLVKTTGDVFRLIPFSVFIIVKIEMAKFLQKTLDEMAVQSPDHRSEKAKEFVEFFYKVRTTGAVATNEEIMKFSKLFEDEITLDSLSRPQLIALCRVLDVQTLGTTNFLRFLLRMRLRSLTADDKLIEKEGVDSLTRTELQQACKARGMRAYGLPESRLREQLSLWLDLSLNKKVSPSLLLLSRALMIPEAMPVSDKLKATISALPDAVVARTKGAIGEKEGIMDHKTNIEIIKMEERKIEEERKEKKEIEPQPIILESSNVKGDEITTTDVKVLEQALDSIGKDNKNMAVEKEEIKELKEEMAEYQEDIQELDQIKAEAKGQEDIENIKVSKGAKRLFNKVNKMISKMDAVLSELEQSEKKVKQRMESLGPEKPDAKDVEELVRIDELVAAIKQIQNVPDEYRLKRIAEILEKIDDDRDGSIKIEDVLKVIELIGKEEVKLSKKQVDELIELMDKEEVLEVEEQIQKSLEKDLKISQEEGNIKATHKSTVPATPVTIEPGFGQEELVDDAVRKTGKSYTGPCVEEGKQKSAAVLKSNTKSDEVKNPPLTSGPPAAKKAEGSKHL